MRVLFVVLIMTVFFGCYGNATKLIEQFSQCKPFPDQGDIWGFIMIMAAGLRDCGVPAETLLPAVKLIKTQCDLDKFRADMRKLVPNKSPECVEGL